MVLFVTLYIVNFIRTIIIILVIYYGFKLFTRYVMPMLINKGVKNMQQKMQNQQRQQKPQRPEGDVTIEGRPQQHQQNNSSNGDYVDFEEVD